MDIKLTNGRLNLVGGDFLLTESYEVSVAQRIQIRLKTTLGKWFLDTQYGVDYFCEVFGKNRVKTRVDNIIINEIEKDVNVLSVKSFNSNIDKKTRRYSAEFKVKLRNAPTEKFFKILTDGSGFSITTENDKYLAV